VTLVRTKNSLWHLHPAPSPAARPAASAPATGPFFPSPARPKLPAGPFFPSPPGQISSVAAYACGRSLPPSQSLPAACDHCWPIPAFLFARLQRRWQPTTWTKLINILSTPPPLLASRRGRGPSACPSLALRCVVGKKGEKRMLQAFVSSVSDVSRYVPSVSC
jgi:hypothetical protein